MATLKHGVDTLRCYHDQGYILTPLASYNDDNFIDKQKGKRPISVDWQNDTLEHNKSFARYFDPERNAGLVLQDNQLVVDIDPRNGGLESLRKFELAHDMQPGDLEAAAHPNVVITGGGGLHLYFSKPPLIPIRHTHDDYPGLEFKSRGRQVVIAGCRHPSGKWYEFKHTPDLANLKPFPERLYPTLKPLARILVSGITGNFDGSISTYEKAIGFLSKREPAIEGHNGDDHTYATIVILKDFGLDPGAAYNLLAEYWNPRCQPQWEADHLKEKVLNAYRYGTKPVGIDSPASDFEALPPPSEAEEALALMFEGDPTAISANEDLASWQSQLLRNKDGQIKQNCARNTCLYLENLPDLAGLFARNLFAGGDTYMVNNPPWSGRTRLDEWDPHLEKQLDDAEMLALWRWLSVKHGYEVSTSILSEAVDAIAVHKPYHPIRTYFDSLIWDETPRIDTWLSEYMGAEDTQYTRAVASKILMGAARRVRDPGTKFDYLPVLEGPQGFGKSTALRIIASTPWFTDSLPDIMSRDSVDQMRGKWIVEIGEMDTATRAEVSALKAFLSRQTDRARLAYARRAMDFPRQCVFIGTTNSTQYLKDETGNRRFWPVLCGVTRSSVDFDGLHRDRDQLWAEAWTRGVLRKEPLYLSREEETLAHSEQEDRMIQDDWQIVIEAWLRETEFTRVKGVQIWENAFGKSPASFDRVAQMRVAACMRRLGWEARVYRENGAIVRGYEGAVTEAGDIFQ